MESVSMALGDYLEALVELGGTPQTAVRPIDLAEYLGVSRPSVCNAVSTLRRKELANQPYRGSITLSQEGYDIGVSIAKRHKIAQRFLADVLKLEDDQVASESNIMKYAIEDEVVPRWVAFIEAQGSSRANEAAPVA